MRLPRQLIIGDSVWTVKFLRDLCPVDDSKASYVVGFCDEENQVLEIRAGMKPFERLRTLIHEALHAIESEYPGVQIPHSLIEKLEVPIARLILDNFT